MAKTYFVNNEQWILQLFKHKIEDHTRVIMHRHNQYM